MIIRNCWRVAIFKHTGTVSELLFSNCWPFADVESLSVQLTYKIFQMCFDVMNGLKEKQSETALSVGHIIGLDTHQAMVKDMFIWRIKALSAQFLFCNISIKCQLYVNCRTICFYGACPYTGESVQMYKTVCLPIFLY